MDLAEANLKDGAEIDSLGDKTITPDEYVYDFSFPKDDGKPNPHLWMNPVFAANYAAADLQPSCPSATPTMPPTTRRISPFTRVCSTGSTRGSWLRPQTIPEQNRKLLTYHDSYAYFAPRYG